MLYQLYPIIQTEHLQFEWLVCECWLKYLTIKMLDMRI